MLADDQEALIRFAYRLWTTRDTNGAPDAAVRAAWNLIDDIAVEGAPTSYKAFKKVAEEILAK